MGPGTVRTALFGCALDVLDSGEKVAMKLAYLQAARQGLLPADIPRDPYELMLPLLAAVPGVKATGGIELDGRLTPRPEESAAPGVSAGEYRGFLDSGGCEAVAAAVREHVARRVIPSRPFMVGVDHSATGGVLEALSSLGAGPALVVLDSHFDAIPSDVRRSAAGGQEARADGLGGLPDSYNCGTWLARIIERGVIPAGRVVVAGVSDRPPDEVEPGERAGMAAYREAYGAWERRGVRVVSKREMRRSGIDEALGTALDAALSTGADSLYVSLDADVASGPEVKAVRFLDTLGLSIDEVVESGACLRSVMERRGAALAGLDVVEVDVHLADIPGSGDRTVEMCLSFVTELLGGG